MNRLFSPLSVLAFALVLTGCPARKEALPQPHTVSIVDSQFVVPTSDHGYQYYKITVPANADEAVVDGHFWVRDGGDHDVLVYVLSEDAFVNFQNGHDDKTFYNSGKKTQEAIEAKLPKLQNETHYYLVFDNTFSRAEKSVEAKVNLHYSL